MAKEKMVYSVVVFRQDQQHIVVTESTDYDKCYASWKALQTEWAAASKEQRPFVLEDPVVTAFTPSLVYEIKLVPVMTEEMASKSHNPYQARMNSQGFGQTFPGASGIDLLSR